MVQTTFKYSDNKEIVKKFQNRDAALRFCKKQYFTPGTDGRDDSMQYWYYVSDKYGYGEDARDDFDWFETYDWFNWKSGSKTIASLRLDYVNQKHDGISKLSNKQDIKLPGTNQHEMIRDKSR